MSAAALNAFQNIWLKEVTGDVSLSLQVINYPLPRDDNSSVRMTLQILFNNNLMFNLNSQADAVLSSPTGFGFAVIVVFGYSFLLANFVSVVVSEKESKVIKWHMFSSPCYYFLFLPLISGKASSVC